MIYTCSLGTAGWTGVYEIMNVAGGCWALRVRGCVVGGECEEGEFHVFTS